jgi:mannobiose 2-epimerase
MENRISELKSDLTIELVRILDYWKEHTVDLEQGGFFGRIDHQGIVDATAHKGLVLNARILYAFSAGYRQTKQAQYLQMAQRAFKYLCTYFYDKTFGGMFWAVDADGKPLDTKKQVYGIAFCIYALSEYHIAFESLQILKQYFISPQGHLHLFFSEDWRLESDTISYGHDIEASWLIWDAAKLVENEQQLLSTKHIILSIAQAARKGLDTDGSLLNESNADLTVWNKERHWWQQAEAMVGWMNAWKITEQSENLDTVFSCWNFIKTHLLDYDNGEWFWGVYQDYSKMIQEDKAGFWKCPYHNTRMCIEMLHRLN